jgi:hypothetical protein
MGEQTDEQTKISGSLIQEMLIIFILIHISQYGHYKLTLRWLQRKIFYCSNKDLASIFIGRQRRYSGKRYKIVNKRLALGSYAQPLYTTLQMH